jgi:membrane associated rhomboid family serine protease
MFIIKLFYESQGIDLDQILGAYYVTSPLFKPFQIVSHFFMHADFFHILMNMWLFVMLGTYLERLWGAKKFFTFYLA